MARILVYCMDFDQPSGGVRRLYRYVSILREEGFDASIVHRTRGFETTWHGIDVPVTSLEDEHHLTENDVLVIPEGSQWLMQRTREFRCHRVVVALNWRYLFQKVEPDFSWGEIGIHRAITPSPVIADWIRWSMGTKDVTVIPTWIDPANYHANDGAAKEDRVVWMGRKSAGMEFAVEALKRKGEPFSGYRWQALSGLSEQDYAETLRGSRIFVAVSEAEGLATSVLEAMACGCLVIGYTGVGGEDVMIGDGPERNCIRVENGNLPGLAKTLEDAVRRLHEDPANFDDRIRNGREMAGRSADPAPEREALKEFFARLTGS